MKSVFFHAGVFGVASVLALSTWLKDDDESATSSAETVEVWGGSLDSLERVRFESDKRTVVLEPKKDGNGRYFVTEVDKLEAPRPPPGHGHGTADAGAPAASEPEKRSTQRFIGVKAAEDLVKQLAPLLAVRRIGSIDAKRAEEFGFDKPEGTLKVKVGGVEQTLILGGGTPGGQERYAKHAASGVVYAVPGDIHQGLLAAESRLLERKLHAFEDTVVTRVRVSKRGKTRDLVPHSEKQGGWADPASPGKLDETAGNWMNKVDRLQVVEYIEKPAAPLRPEDAVVRVEYFAGSQSLGHLELFKLPGDDKANYMAVTEHVRWPVKVLASAAEQVDQDLGSVLK